MVCTHLKELYQLCETNQLRIGSSDLVRIICRQCDKTETCPSVLMDEYDSQTVADDTSDELPQDPAPDKPS